MWCREGRGPPRRLLQAARRALALSPVPRPAPRRAAGAGRLGLGRSSDERLLQGGAERAGRDAGSLHGADHEPGVARVGVRRGREGSEGGMTLVIDPIGVVMLPYSLWFAWKVWCSRHD